MVRIEEHCIQGVGVDTWRERVLQSHRRRLEDNIKMYIKETGLEDVDLIDLAGDTDK